MQFHAILICTECKTEKESYGVYGTNYMSIKSDIIHYLENKGNPDCDNCDGFLTVKEIKFKPNHMKLFD
jgi:hypothetical protein